MIIENIKKIFIKQIAKSASNFLENKLSSSDLKELSFMMDHLHKAPSIYRPSKYWMELNLLNVRQLYNYGYENFKKTIALNYFTFVRITPLNPQIIFLIKNIPFSISRNLFLKAIFDKKHDFFSKFNYIQSVLYNFLTYASYYYAKTIIRNRKLLKLTEPPFGNPPRILNETDQLISQDLINSMLEVDSITNGIEKALGKIKGIHVLELGAGYGRDAYVLINSMKIKQYIIVDIPPALWVSQKYLIKLFPKLKVFKYREIQDFRSHLNEFKNANLVFITPTQLAKLKPGSIDLIITISSLHEMRFDQIHNYFKQFQRLLKLDGYFYFKQWYKARVLFEDIVIRVNDYPIPKGWKLIFSRAAQIHPRLFEALYKKNN